MDKLRKVLLSIDVSLMSPDSVASAERIVFEKLVLKGGEVNAATLPRLIDRSLVLAFAKNESKPVGVGAIKRPNHAYRYDIFKQARSDLSPADFEFELGWVYVDENARGMGVASRMVAALVPSLAGRPAYATSRVNNWAMHASLTRFGFRPEGVPYPSKQNAPAIQLFVTG